MKTDELLKSFDSLMKRKHKRKLSGSYEAKAYKEQVKKLREHYLFQLSKENQDK